MLAAHQAAYATPSPPSLKSRVLFHCAHKRGDEAALMQRHQELGESLEDELSLASVGAAWARACRAGAVGALQGVAAAHGMGPPAHLQRERCNYRRNKLSTCPNMVPILRCTIRGGTTRRRQVRALHPFDCQLSALKRFELVGLASPLAAGPACRRTAGIATERSGLPAQPCADMPNLRPTH